MEGEDRHLQAFCAFVTARGLADALARRDWAAFARGYNGPAYAANRYDARLAQAYAAASGGPCAAEAKAPRSAISRRGWA